VIVGHNIGPSVSRFKRCMRMKLSDDSWHDQTPTRRALCAAGIGAACCSIFGAPVDVSAATNWWGDDGSADAPAGTPQHPDYFTSLFRISFPYRPPWKVAGVDYRVGPRINTFMDHAVWFATNPTGVTHRDGGYYFDNSSGLIVQGVDFTGDSGAGVEAFVWTHSTCSNITFRDCKFRQIANTSWVTSLHLANSGYARIEYCEVNGNGYVAKPPFGATDVWFEGVSARVDMTFCWIYNAWSQNIAFSGADNSSLYVKYCLIEEAGLKAGPKNTGFHGDWIYTDGITGFHINNISIRFCTFKQSAPTVNSPYANTQGLALQINASSPIYETIDVSYCTFAVARGAFVNRYVIYSYLELAGTITIESNYVDSANLGSAPAWIENADARSRVSGSQNGTRHLRGNINMRTGGPADYGSYVSGTHTGMN
jgi:hypothetical protein